jgi:hypothetical protein
LVYSSNFGLFNRFYLMISVLLLLSFSASFATLFNDRFNKLTVLAFGLAVLVRGLCGWPRRAARNWSRCKVDRLWRDYVEKHPWAARA